MKENIATINGLIDGISVVEKDNKTHSYLETAGITDILYDNKEITEKDFEDFCYQEEFVVSEYDPELFNQPVTLLCTEQTEQIKNI